MDFKIFFSDKGIGDFNQIVEYFAAESPELAEMVGASLLAHVRCLAGMPIIGTPMAKRANVYKLYHSPYAIFYRLNRSAGTVEILHMYQGVRRKSVLLAPQAS